jgi:hypothetical protein
MYYITNQIKKQDRVFLQSSREYGQSTNVWTLELAAEVSDETIRATLARLGVRWKRVKQGGTTNIFITDGIEGALRQARAAAGGADI